MATIVKPTKTVNGRTVAKNPEKPFTVRYSTQRHDEKCKPGCSVKYHQRERSFATSREANDFKAKFEHDSRESIFVDPKSGKIDFCDYAANWIENLDRKPSTKKAYRSVLSSQIRPAFTGRTLAQVANDREGVWSLISGMQLSASRKETTLTVIRGACDEAVKSARIGAHRLSDLKIEKDAQEPAVIIPATEAELQKLADGLAPRFELVVWLQRGAGLRISEALAVNIKNFRENGKVLRIFEQVSEEGTLSPLKHRKRGEYRDAPVPSWLWKKVQVHIDTYGAQDGYLFKFDGKFTTYKMFQPRFATAAKNAGLPMTTHSLRHLYVSKLLDGGCPITDVADWIGHRDIRITHQVYSHLMPNAWDRARNALETL